MSELSQDTCAALMLGLADPDPERSVTLCLSALEDVGLHLAAEDRAPDVSVATSNRRIELWAEFSLSSTTRAMIEAALAVALERCFQQTEQRRIEERLQLLSSASFEGVFANIDGEIVEANLRLAEMLRCDVSDLIGHWAIRNCIAPEDLADVQRHVVTGYEGAYVITAVRKDGTRFRAELQSKQSRLGERPVRVVAVRDVTERERTLAQLRESETRLQELADAAFDLTVLSHDGVILEARGAVQQLLGGTREAVVGRKILEFVADSSFAATEKVLAEQTTGTYHVWFKSELGENVPAEVIGVNSTLGGKPIRIAGLRDLRDLQRREKERRELERQIEQSQRLESLGVLAGGIAHDFNNLLVGILGNADLLLSAPKAADDQEALLAIVSAAEKAASLTAQLLAYAGRAEFVAASSVNLGELFAELRTLLFASLSKKAVLNIEIDAELAVLAEPTRLTQVLMNLLTNASDALHGGAGHINVRSERLTDPGPSWRHSLGATVGPGDWIQIEVRDTGSGMAPATLERIFEPFFTTKEKGHGLGLAACLGIVTSHGGALLIESALGAGTCIRVLLPAAANAPRMQEQLQVHAVPCRVLVVDDEPIVRLQLRRCLDSFGYQMSEASNGRDGLEALKQLSVDVVILDLTMPDLDGAQVVGRMLELGLTTPVVLASGYLDAETDQRLSATIVKARLRKPYRLRDLLVALETARVSGQP